MRAAKDIAEAVFDAVLAVEVVPNEPAYRAHAEIVNKVYRQIMTERIEKALRAEGIE